MSTLMMIFGGALFGAIAALISGLISPKDTEPQKWKPKKKNFFVRLGESGNPKYNWMGGYTESD